jgi:hypothetical protein
MDELIQKVQQSAGIDANQAQQAIDTVIQHLEGLLPDEIGSQLRGLVEGTVDGGGFMEKMQGMTGGMTGR